jgi:ribonuclease BN (tRNA processing enzyme)
MACHVAQMSGARRLILVHHNPIYDDEMVAALEHEAQKIFPNTIAGYEGLEIEL